MQNAPGTDAAPAKVYCVEGTDGQLAIMAVGAEGGVLFAARREGAPKQMDADLLTALRGDCASWPAMEEDQIIDLFRTYRLSDGSLTVIAEAAPDGEITMYMDRMSARARRYASSNQITLR